jgi:hypothetical protein
MAGFYGHGDESWGFIKCGNVFLKYRYSHLSRIALLCGAAGKDASHSLLITKYAGVTESYAL